MGAADFFDPFAVMRRTGVDCVCFLRRFGAIPKNYVFLIGTEWMQNLVKSSRGAPKGRKGFSENRTEVPFWDDGAPGGASRARDYQYINTGIVYM